ncbi:MAG: DUF2007 domain-containing protein [Pseudomonadales bacterium]|jgi:hypothetical protein|nr:DUF2007 domain-containing protein [Pseudomonadales bacterium]
MAIAYAAESSIDAHLVKGLLEQRGVPVHMVGHHLEGGVGELPAGGLVHLLVPDDWMDIARAVVADYEARRLAEAEADAFEMDADADLMLTGTPAPGTPDPPLGGLGTRDWLLITGALALLVLLAFAGRA